MHDVLLPPAPLDPNSVEYLEKVWSELPIHRQTLPFVFVQIARNRIQLAGAVFVVGTSPDKVGYLVLYAKQSPSSVTFLKLSEVNFDDPEHQPLVGAYFDENRRWYKHVYSWKPWQFFDERSIPWSGDDELYVLEEGHFTRGGFWVSDDEPLHWNRLLLRLLLHVVIRNLYTLYSSVYLYAHVEHKNT